MDSSAGMSYLLNQFQHTMSQFTVKYVGSGRMLIKVMSHVIRGVSLDNNYRHKFAGTSVFLSHVVGLFHWYELLVITESDSEYKLGK